MKQTQKIFCIGLSRTGTSTLHHILEKLGFNSCHFCNPLLRENDWDAINQFDTLGDTPIPMLYKECDERFPDSKFILTTRNKKSWLKSMKWMLSHGKVIWNWDDTIHDYHQKFYGTKTFKPRILNQHWDDYHAEIERYFSGRKDDLLIIKIEEGFNIPQICRFLAIDTHDFPVQKENAKRDAPLRDRIHYNLIQKKNFMRTKLASILKK